MNYKADNVWQYAKDNKLNFDNPFEMKWIVDYYNSLF